MQKMNTMFMNSENSKRSNLTDKIDLRRKD